MIFFFVISLDVSKDLVHGPPSTLGLSSPPSAVCGISRVPTVPGPAYHGYLAACAPGRSTERAAGRTWLVTIFFFEKKKKKEEGEGKKKKVLKKSSNRDLNPDCWIQSPK